MMVLWVMMLRGTIVLPTTLAPVTWHFHELLFGFVAAAVAGFLLTAIPNWTGRLPLQGWPLGALVLLWILGRLAVATSHWIGPISAALIDLAFLLMLFTVVLREVVAGRNWRNLPVIAAIGLLVVANAMVHAGTLQVRADGGVQWEASGERLAIAVLVMLISLIGGRVIPSFTTNWLRQRHVSELPAPFGRFDKLVLAVTLLAVAMWAVGGVNAGSGVALVVAAIAHAIRLARWRGFATLAEPLLWILHLGYLWLPVGLGLLGLAAWLPGLQTAGIHSLAVGAMGTMILAVMTRASLGHTKRALTANRGTLVVFILILAAAVSRVIAPFLDVGYTSALEMAGGAWIAAFGLFVLLYLPLYARR